ncbi:MAG: RpiB/LacA/LacB family sugar-phosphate isomerase [Planctomycetota bacterium]
MSPEDLRSLVRRAVARATSSPAIPRTAGVHVDLTPPPARERRRPGPPLVTVECLARVPEGGAFPVPAGAVVTPAARDEAWRRRIRLGGTPAAAGPWRVAVGADHGGFAKKHVVLAAVREAGHEPIDLGTYDATPVDYPDIAATVARGVAEGRFSVGILLDGAGIGSAMAANKIDGALAANCYDERTAKNAREHNYANVLTLGARLLNDGALDRIVRAFLATPHGEARHGVRVDKIRALELRPGHQTP